MSIFRFNPSTLCNSGVLKGHESDIMTESYLFVNIERCLLLYQKAGPLIFGLCCLVCLARASFSDC